MAPHSPLPEFMNLEELSALARNCMTKQAYEYYASGAETETSVADNRSAFEDYRIVPRILVDVSSVDTRSHLYGELRQHYCSAAARAVCMLRATDKDVAAVLQATAWPCL